MFVMSKEWIDIIGEWLDSDEDVVGELEGVQLKGVESSNLAAVGYDSKRRELIVAFLDGSVYRFYSVGPTIHRALMMADSHGTYFYHRIRNGYPYERIN